MDSLEEFFFKKTFGEDWKKEARSRQIKLDPDQNYCPAQVAAIISRIYDSALLLMKKLGASGASNLVAPKHSHRVGKTAP
jgi:hypothetical protein